jgi:type II secretory pathway component GspD/PulD (secretin)
MDIQKFGIDSVRRIVVIKDRITRVIPALAVLRQLLHHRPEVRIEVEFVEVIENSALDYGLRLPTSFGVAWLGKLFNLPSVPTIPEGFTNFVTFGGGKTLFGIGVAGAEMFANFSKGSTRTLLTAELRSVDGQPAQFHVGDKYPILTTGYFGTTTGRGEVHAPPPAFNFEDLGVVVKVTPKVHGWDEMSLEVDAEYKVLTGEALNGIPIIANRKFASRARVRSGEWAILAGLVRASEARVITGMAGLAQLPAIGALFRRNTTAKDSGHTLFIIKPRLLSPPLSEVITRPLWTGTETRGLPAL